MNLSHRWAWLVAHPVAFWLRCLWAFAMFTQCCAGRGQARLWILAAIFPPLVLLLVEPEFRRRQWKALQNLRVNATATERTIIDRRIGPAATERGYRLYARNSRLAFEMGVGAGPNVYFNAGGPIIIAS